MRTLFIYWRVDAANLADALAATAAFQSTLEAGHPTLTVGLYRRTDAEAGHHGTATLMETYAMPGGIGDTLQAELAAAGNAALQRWCQGSRHVEAFDAVRLPDAASQPLG